MIILLPLPNCVLDPVLRFVLLYTFSLPPYSISFTQVNVLSSETFYLYQKYHPAYHVSHLNQLLVQSCYFSVLNTYLSSLSNASCTLLNGNARFILIAHGCRNILPSCHATPTSHPAFCTSSMLFPCSSHHFVLPVSQ